MLAVPERSMVLRVVRYSQFAHGTLTRGEGQSVVFWGSYTQRDRAARSAGGCFRKSDLKGK